MLIKGLAFLVPIVFRAQTSFGHHDNRYDCKGSEDRVSQLLSMRHEGTLLPLSVPRRYLEDRADLVQGAVHSAQLFRIDPNTLKPVSRKEAGELIKRREANYLTILLSDTIDLSAILSIHEDNYQDEINNELEENTLQYGDALLGLGSPTTTEGNILESSGFLNLGSPTTSFNAGGHRFYFIGDFRAPEILLRCVGNPTIESRVCRLYHRYRGIDITVSFSEKEFDEISEITLAAEEFVDCITSF